MRSLWAVGRIGPAALAVGDEGRSLQWPTASALARAAYRRQPAPASGEQDHIAPPAALEPLASAAACQLIVVPGADHGWWPGVDALHEHVLAFTRSLIAP